MPGWRSTERATARLTVEAEDGRTALVFGGRLNAAGAGELWRAAIRAATGARGAGLRCDLVAVEVFDLAGAALLLAAERAHGAPIELTGANPRATALLALARSTGAVVEAPAASPVALPGEVQAPVQGAVPGQTQRQVPGQPARRPLGQPRREARWQAMLPVLAATVDALANGVAFFGEAMVAVLRLPSRRRMLPLRDLLRFADQAGVRALPLVMLLGYLMGLILAFQSAIPMHRFGADLFVADLVTISLVRELGPLLSAVILAGRTGSAFAAEIGTMKVNQELDALVTMGLDPMTMLVLPRLIAVMLVLPALALALDIAGLFGMATVMRGFDFPMVAILHQVQGAASVTDLLGGLFKAICFGAAIAAIGCRAGLSTGSGPRAVGLSATAAVVGGIISTIALDGLLAVLFYRLDL